MEKLTKQAKVEIVGISGLLVRMEVIWKSVEDVITILRCNENTWHLSGNSLFGLALQQA